MGQRWWLVGVAAAVLLLAGGAWIAMLANRTGTVVLVSDPPGASVLVGSSVVGQTPHPLVARGSSERYPVTIRLEGYEDWTGPVRVEVGLEEQLAVQLRPLPATLTLTSQPEGARVRLLGTSVEGYTPLVARDVPAGRYTVELEHPAHESVREAVQVQAGAHVVRGFTLHLARASLAVDGDEGARGVLVYVEDVLHGPLPLTLANLAPGSARVRAELDGSTVWEESVELLPGRQSRVEVILVHKPSKPLLAGDQRLGLGEKLAPVAVIVENSADARPQSGLHAASFVYEAMAEGGISRFLAVYMQGASEAVGPVRSARHYFVRLAREFNAVLVHIGASPQGFQSLATLAVPNLDEAAGDPGFWRSRARVAPHNAYVSTASVRSAIPSREDGTYAGFSFDTHGGRLEGAPAGELEIDYGFNYGVVWEYVPATNDYLRYMARGPHVDAETGEQIRAANVITLTVPTYVLDDAGRLEMEQVGEGRARVFRDGRVVEGRWRKMSLWATTEILDADGKPILLNPGATWVQIVPQSASLSY